LESAAVFAIDDGPGSYLYFMSFSPELLTQWASVLPRHNVGLTLGAGPSFLSSGVVVDEELRLDTYALGGRAHARVMVWATRSVSFDFDFSLSVYGTPNEPKTWFNKPLRHTVLSALTVGVSWDVGSQPN
jgi:hypothetical protein